MICSITGVTQTMVWSSFTESRSEARVRFKRVYLSISCNTGTTCAGQAMKTLKHYVKTQTQTHTLVHVIFHRGSGLPPYQAEKTVVGGGEFCLSGHRFPLKKIKSHKHHSDSVCAEQVQTARGVLQSAMRGWVRWGLQSSQNLQQDRGVHNKSTRVEFVCLPAFISRGSCVLYLHSFTAA